MGLEKYIFVNMIKKSYKEKKPHFIKTWHDKIEINKVNFSLMNKILTIIL